MSQKNHKVFVSGRGYLITFEGGEGSGKTTLMEHLSIWLTAQKLEVVSTRAPGGTTLGQQIRHLLLHDDQRVLDPKAELFLFLADRAQHVTEVIAPALTGGKIVLCDRFNDSTIAYQGVARGFSSERVAAECAFACSGLTPDLTFYLDVNPEIGFARASNSRSGKDRIESEDLSFHRQIRHAFLQLAEKEPQRIAVLDASQSANSVLAAAQTTLSRFLGSR